MRPGLQLSTKQNVSMNLKMQQAIRLLQLSAHELETEIQAALESNPLLEVVEANEDATIDSSWDAEIEVQSRQINTLELNDSGSDATLREYLYWQLDLTPFTDIDRLIAINIIDAIADDGYLTLTLEEIYSSLINNFAPHFVDVAMPEILAVLQRIQQFDPLGVAARNLQECMLIQLQVLPKNSKLAQHCKQIIFNHLHDLGQKDYLTIKAVMQITDSELQDAIRCITKLNPKPGYIISNIAPEYIVPDVLATRINNTWGITLNDLYTKIRVNPEYAAILKGIAKGNDSQYLRDQLAAAQWLLNSIKNRNVTLLKVATYIVSYQRQFLERGEEAMRPLTLQQIAGALDLSESTISRITSKKYLHTPRGVFELKFFLSSHVRSKNGDNCSSTAVKAIIKNLIQQENSHKPLSDQELMQLIAQRGIIVARRTVTKYREALGIQSSSQRGG